MYDRKLVIVQNPYSTRHREVQAGVFDRLDAAGITTYDTITTRCSQAADNIDDLAGRLPHDAHIISVAGDGTSTQMVNAGLRPSLITRCIALLAMAIVTISQEANAILCHCCRPTVIPSLISRHQPLSIEVNSEP